MCLMVDYMTTVFFFNYTATNEIYTYLHTLSLHDALPIYGADRAHVVVPLLSAGSRVAGRVKWKVAPLPGSDSAQTRPSWRVMTRLTLARPRSEEHTSELQSLMRISYAVFCLKKKNVLDKFK